MANLIPPDAKKKVKLEYWVRVFSVWMLLLGFALWVVMVLLLPSWVLVNDQLDTFTRWHQKVDQNNDQFTASENDIKYANQVASVLKTNNNFVMFSDLIEEVKQEGGEGIGLTEYSLSRKGGVIEGFSITGVASSRKTLADFKTRLEHNDTFVGVELPLSNLAKDVNIPFNIKISLIVNEEDL